MTYQLLNLKTISKQEVPAGNRLCRVIAKGKNTKLAESLGVWLPATTVTAVQVVMNNETGREFLCNAVAAVQDGIVRKLAEAGKLAVFAEQIDIDAVLQAMAAENESARFSSKSIEAWFASTMKPVLIDALNAKGYGNQVEKLCKNYLDSFMVLAGRNPSMNGAIKAGLIRCMELLPQDQDDAVTVEIARRLADVQEASAVLAAL